MKYLAVLGLILSSMAHASCGAVWCPDEPPSGMPRPEYPDDPPPVAESEDSDIQPGDSIAIQACKLSAVKNFAPTFGSAKKFFEYQDRWRKSPGPTVKADAKYLLSIANDSTWNTRTGYWADARRIYIELKAKEGVNPGFDGGLFPGARVVHATGLHSCWSNEVIGYTCNVENRMYNDCNTAVSMLQRTNCCGFSHPGGVSNGFTVTGCY